MNNSLLENPRGGPSGVRKFRANKAEDVKTQAVRPMPSIQVIIIRARGT